MHHHSAQFLDQCDDGCFAFSASNEIVSEIIAIRDSSEYKHKYKYTDIIKISEKVSREEKKIRPIYYERAASAIERKIGINP